MYIIYNLFYGGGGVRELPLGIEFIESPLFMFFFKEKNHIAMA